MNYYPQHYPKKQIVLHHTAGSHHPGWVADGWDANKKKIGTAWIIGGKANPPFKDDQDGRVVEYFPDTAWAHHLGISDSNYAITKASIGIELCNYGQLILNKTGQYLTYVNSLVPPDQVVRLDKPFRGYEFFEAYTEAQIESLRVLLLDIASRHNIDLHEGMYKLLKNGGRAFEMQTSALGGKPGLYTHVNYRRDKIDCYPHPGLVEMILNL